MEALVGGDVISGFRITYRKRGEEADRVVFARRVILALGHANLVSRPDWAMSEDFPRGRLLHYEEVVSGVAMADGVDVRRHFHSLLGFEGHVSAPLRGMRVVIVDGGQTVVHLAQLAVSELGCRPTDVTFVSRSALRSQPFDVSVEWLSARRYESMARFWSHDHEHRERMLREAKGGRPCNAGSSGASVDGECVEWLRSSGVHVREQCEVLSAYWLPNPTNFSNGEWNVELWDDLHCNDEWLDCDLIWLATGNSMDFLKEPLVRSLRNSLHAHEIRTQGKLPVLNQDLWLQLVSDRSSSNEKGFRCDEGVGVHVMGAYAALELGPGALNLMGARAGACSIPRSIGNFHT